MASVEAVLAAFGVWYDGLPRQKKHDGHPAKGAVAAALVVLERLRDMPSLSVDDHLTDGGAQIADLNRPNVLRILSRYDVTEGMAKEVGRTNRGNPRIVRELLDGINQAGFAKLASKRKTESLGVMQRFLALQFEEYTKLAPLAFVYDSAAPIKVIVSEILVAASKRNQAGPVAQHMVGAKLAIRFPRLSVSNFAYSAADDQAGRAGDFHLNDTVFHVTVAPTRDHVRKCGENLRNGLAAFLLVTDAGMRSARVYLDEEDLASRVALEPVESFVGQNVSELAQFDLGATARQVYALLTEYNRRVSEVETDHSLFIDIPRALSGNKK